MHTVSKTGFIPSAPTSLPDLKLVPYKDPEIDDAELSVAASRGELDVIYFRRAADPNRSRALMRFFRRKLDPLGFDENAGHRLALALGETISNAMQHAVPGSSVGITLAISGQPPNRQLMLSVSNFILRGASLPDKENLPPPQDILDRVRGHGTGIVQAVSSGQAAAVSRDYEVLVAVLFKETLP